MIKNLVSASLSYKAFHIIMDDEAKQVDIEPITRVEHIELNDLVGYDAAESQAVEESPRHLPRGSSMANNCLLLQ